MIEPISESTVSFTVNRLKPVDRQLLRLIQRRGPVTYHKLKAELGDRAGDALACCRSRELVMPVRKSEHYYMYDLTDLGLAVLRSLRACEGASEAATATGERGV